MSNFFKDDMDKLNFNNKGFSIRNKYLSKKNDSFYCSYSGCHCKSVNSHTISKESSLRNISENNELLSFVGRRDKNANITPRIKEISINDATTFKGFCGTHEDIFKSIDLEGISTKGDLILQIYRQVAYSNYNCGILEQLYKGFEDRQFETLLKQSKGIPDYIVRANLNADNERKFKRNKIISEFLNKFTCNLNSLTTNSCKLSNEEIFYIDELNLTVFFKRINYLIPVALINDFGFNYNGEIANCYFSVIPESNSTNLIMVVEKDFESWAKNLWTTYTQSYINILNFIEVLMMLSEFWFIKPSILNQMSNEKKEFLTLDIRYINERNFKEYDVSIFDNIRKGLIFTENRDIQEKELKKINSLPQRDPIKLREDRLTSYISNFY